MNRMIIACIIIVMMMSVIPEYIFAEGTLEYSDARIPVQIAPSFSMGRMKLSITLRENTVKYKFVLLRKNDMIYNWDGNPTGNTNLTNYLPTSSPGSVKIQRNIPFNINLIWINEIRWGNAAVNSLSEIEEILDNDVHPEKFEFFLPLACSEEADIEIWGIKENGACDYFKARLALSFFSTESLCFRRAFGDNSQYSYKEKALSFMASFFEIDLPMQTKFLNLCKKIFGNINIPRFPINPINPMSDEDLNGYKNDFKRAMGYCFTLSRDRNSFPYWDMRKEDFPVIYGSETTYDTNPYITAYLHFLFYQDNDKAPKPLFSYFIQDTLKNENDIMYDYRDFSLLTPDEGNEAARAALKYLTWGVEYTPMPVTEDYLQLPILNNVYFDNQDIVNRWIDNNQLSENFVNKNYFDGIISSVDNSQVFLSDRNFIPQKAQILNIDFNAQRIRVGYELNDFRAFSLSRMDIWASRNLGWEPGVVDCGIRGKGSPIAENQGLNIIDPNHVPGDSQFMMESNTGNYFDKIIQHSEDDSVVKIDRSMDGNGNPQSIFTGFRLEQPRSIKALLIVTGWGYVNPTNISGNRINYRINGSPQWVKLWVSINGSGLKELTGVKEYTYNFINQTFSRYENGPVSNWNGLGFAISCGNEFTDDNNNRNSFLFYVFDEAVEDCTGLVFEDHTGSPALVIAELGIFEENPIPYLTAENFFRCDDSFYRLNTNMIEQRISNFRFSSGSNKVYEDASWITSSGVPFKSNRDEGRNNYAQFHQFLFFNTPGGAVWQPTSIRGGSGWFQFDLASDYPVTQIVLWEPGSGETPTDTSQIFKQGFTLSTNFCLDNAFNIHPVNQELINKVYEDELITTPFKNAKTGNPIPYAPGGIDSPRTFNYKMVQQNEAREAIIDSSEINNFYRSRFAYDAQKKMHTTKAQVSAGLQDYHRGYIKEMEIIGNSGLKPFLPNLYNYTEKGYSDNPGNIYRPDKTAGADSLSILMGSLAMTDKRDSFLNVYNQFSVSRLDRFYKGESMLNTIAPGGMDNRGYPIFYADEYSTLLNTSYRFTRGDLEKSSVVVPDLRKVQPGDIVVRFSGDYEPHIGIVIRTCWNQGETESLGIQELMGRIIVLSTSREYRAAHLGVWGNIIGPGGFTTEPEAYHVRRLLKLKSGGLPSNQMGVKDNWELIDRVIAGLEVAFTTTEHNRTSHWIPNTKEFLKLENVKITGVFSNGEKEPLEQDSIRNRIVLMPPLDMYREDEPVDHPPNSNIYKNRGESLEFWVIDNTGDVFYHIADFILTGELDENGSPYRIEYILEKHNKLRDGVPNTATSSSFGNPSNPEYIRSLFITGCDGTLQFAAPDGNPCAAFGIRPGGTKAFPGDDFLLRFALATNENIIATAPEKNFCAVYDKKLLWRANLYIAETPLVEDWNNAYPWDAPVTENEWNVNYDFDTLINIFHADNNAFKLTVLERGDGGQVITPHDFTWSQRRGNDGNISRKVGYDYNGQDNPFEFNFKMDNQKKIMQKYYNSDGVYFVDGILPDNSELWNEYTAPGNNHSNYLHSSSIYKLERIGTKTNNNYNQELDSDAIYIDAEEISIGGMTYRPYIPALSNSIMGTANNANSISPQHNTAGYTAGTDCLGFVQKSASYDGSPYLWIQGRMLHSVFWGQTRGSTWFPLPDNNSTDDLSWEIAHEDKTENIENGEIRNINLNKIVPGDIVVYYEEENGISEVSHIMLVNRIEFAEDSNSRFPVLRNINLIESVYSERNLLGNIIISRNIQNFTGNGEYELPRTWQINRLKLQEE